MGKEGEDSPEVAESCSPLAVGVGVGRGKLCVGAGGQGRVFAGCVVAAVTGGVPGEAGK